MITIFAVLFEKKLFDYILALRTNLIFVCPVFRGHPVRQYGEPSLEVALIFLLKLYWDTPIALKTFFIRRIKTNGIDPMAYLICLVFCRPFRVDKIDFAALQSVQ